MWGVALTFMEVWTWISCISYLKFSSHLSGQLVSTGKNQKKREGRPRRGDHWKRKDAQRAAKLSLLLQEATLIPLTTSLVSQNNLSNPEVELEKIDVYMLQTPGGSRAALVTKAIFYNQAVGSIPWLQRLLWRFESFVFVFTMSSYL